MFNVILLGITSLLTDVSSEMVVPILPAFIQSVGGGAVAIGLIFGVGDAVAALLRVISGYWADRTKRYRGFTLAGYVFSAGAKFLYPFAFSWPVVAFVRPLERLGKGFRDAPRDAIISESVPDSGRGRAFGIQRAMDSAGAVLGSVMVLVLFLKFGLSFRTLFFISASIGSLAVLPVLAVRVPHTLTAARGLVSVGRIPDKARRFIVIATVFALANFSVAFLILRAQGLFEVASGFRDSLAFALAAYIAFNVVDALLSAPAGSLSDRWGRRRTILVGYLTFAVVCAGFAALSWHQPSNPLAVILVLFGLYGVFKAFTDAAQRAFVSDLSGDEIRATALGAFETSTGLAAVPASLIAGALYSVDPAGAFVFGSAVSLVATVLLARFLRTR